MATFHDEVEIEDFEYNEETGVFTYPCPCGDLFSITRDQLEDGEDIARCGWSSASVADTHTSQHPPPRHRSHTQDTPHFSLFTRSVPPCCTLAMSNERTQSYLRNS